MASLKFIVLPQRSNGSCYIEVPATRATSWAVFAERRFRGKTYRVLKSRHATKTQAEGDRKSLELNAAGPIRRYVLGRRMVR